MSLKHTSILYYFFTQLIFVFMKNNILFLLVGDKFYSTIRLFLTPACTGIKFKPGQNQYLAN